MWAVASAIHAQGAAAAAANDDLTEVVVTGSRVITNGFSAPTPITVLTAEQMQATAPTSISDALNQLPQIKSSYTPATTGFAATANGGNGGAYANLRGLNPKRVLVLLDGKRVVQSQANGGVAGAVDLSILPQSLIRNVDVVTGGASAAYGSDALTGVLNFVLDTKLTGFKGELRGGTTKYGDNQNYDGSLAWGSAFAGGRGHVIASVEYFHTNGIYDYTDRPYANGMATIANCAVPQTSIACPSRIIAGPIKPSTMSSGGLITGGATALRGQTFYDAGQVKAFPVRHAAQHHHHDRRRHRSGAGPVLQLRAGQLTQERLRARRIRTHAVVDRPWRRAVRRVREPLPRPAFLHGADRRFHAVCRQPLSAGFGGGADERPRSDQRAAVQPGDGPVQRRHRQHDHRWPHQPRSARTGQLLLHLHDAPGGRRGRQAGRLDSGRVLHAWRGRRTTTSRTACTSCPTCSARWTWCRSPGTAGLPATGTPICRVRLINAGNPCVPLNVVGQNVATPEAIAYINGTGTGTLKQNLKQDAWELTIRGEPFSTWAGPVALGGGIAYRSEELDGSADALATAYNPANAGTVAFRPA